MRMMKIFDKFWETRKNREEFTYGVIELISGLLEKNEQCIMTSFSALNSYRNVSDCPSFKT